MARRRTINPPLNIYKKIAITFIVLTLVLIAVVFYYAMNYAYVNVTANPDPIASEFNIVVVNDEEQADGAQGVFQGAVVSQQASTSGVFEAKGIKSLKVNGDGRVKIINNYSREQPLVATTRLLTESGDLFRIRDSVTVPAGQSAEVDIYADNEGAPVEISAGTRFSIPGLWEGIQDRIYAESLGEITGDEIQLTVLAQEDVDSATEALSEKLIREIIEDTPSGSMRVLTKEVVSQELNAEIGEEVESFTLDLELQVSGVLIDSQVISSFARQTMESLVPTGRKLAVIDNTVLLEVEKIDPEEGIAQLKGSINGESVIREDNDILERDRLIGLSEDELVAYLENFDSIERVSVRFFPGWVKTVPSLADHIIIVVE